MDEKNIGFGSQYVLTPFRLVFARFASYYKPHAAKKAFLFMLHTGVYMYFHLIKDLEINLSHYFEKPE